MTTLVKQPPAEKLPPHSQESEEAILGSILINPNVMPLVADWLCPEHFLFMQHRFVYAAMQALLGNGENIDVLTVSEQLQVMRDSDGRNYHEKIGGSSFLTYLVNNTPTHIHAETYARIVERLAARRRLLQVAGQIGNLALDEHSTIDDLLYQAQDLIQEAIGTRPDNHLATLAQATRLHMEIMTERYESQDEFPGVPSGFTLLDRTLNGLKKGRFTVLAARPGVGKTSFAMNVALSVARRGKGVMFFSLEMTQDELMDRLYAIETGITAKQLETGRLTEEQYALYVEAAARLEKLPIYIDDSTNPTLAYIRSKAQRIQHEHGLALVIVDYIGLMQTDKSETRNLEIAAITRGLKAMAKELGVHVIGISQLNRGVEGRQSSKPMLSDLRDSGALEQDANHVLFLWHDNDASKPTLTVAKNRGGELRDIPMTFSGALTRFAERV